MVIKKTVVSLFIVGVALVGVVSQSHAGGTGGAPVCQVVTNNALGGANIIGSAAITVENQSGTSGDVDAMLRLRYGSKEDVFRAHIGGANLISPEEVLCQILQSNGGQGPLNKIGQPILSAFSLGATTIKFNNKALTGVSFETIAGTGGLLGGPHSSGLGEVTLYAQ